MEKKRSPKMFNKEKNVILIRNCITYINNTYELLVNNIISIMRSYPTILVL